jgi:hypothetical protein
MSRLRWTGAGRVASVACSAMDQPVPDPDKLLAFWEEWERGEQPPGRVIANLKTAGMPQLLRQLVADGWTARAE